MDHILDGDIDIYQELGVQTNAPIEEITRKYRRMALRYHPDKNQEPEAEEKFHFFSVIHSILMDPVLRQQYDRIRVSRNKKSADVQQQLHRFRQELQRQEDEARRTNTRNTIHTLVAVNLGQLQAAGLNLRRAHQRRLCNSSKYVSYRDLPRTTTNEFLQPLRVHVRWKRRDEELAQIDADVLSRLMSQFGHVEGSWLRSSDGNYGSGIVEYRDLRDAVAATQHNYKKSARLWDGTPDRKVASLLRGAELWGFPGEVGEQIEERLSSSLK